MDAALHLAAGISDPRQPLVLRVPASVGSISAEALHPGRVHPSASQTGNHVDTVTCGIKLRTPTNASGAQVSGLVAKEMKPAVTKEKEEAVADFLYETEMQACQLVARATSTDRSIIASLGDKQSMKARLLYGQLTQQDIELPGPLSTNLIIDATKMKEPCHAATR